MNTEKNGPRLRSYPAPWTGELLLFCTKCSRKLKKQKHGINVRKWMKKRAKQDETSPKLRVLGVPCVKMCPKGGITVATQKQLGQSPTQVSIIRSEDDLKILYEQLSA